MAEVSMDSLRINVERALRRYPVPSFDRAVGDILAEIADSLWLAQVQQATQVETLRSAADGWGDGSEGFPHHWLMERAAEAESGKIPDWNARD